jgi:Na+/H+ antiporter NhaD/arsenite permease-like protein
MTWILLSIFLLGYLFIVLEKNIKLDKAATALLMGVCCWVFYIIHQGDATTVNHELAEHIGEISGILFFLIGAMTIVELIDLHQGFQIVSGAIKTSNKRTFLVIITVISFFLSSILDNLTTSIVMCTLVSKILSDAKDRYISIGMVVIASNAGGAWSPIGDVTTTMLWIGHQITTDGIIKKVFLPGVVSALVPLAYLVTKLKGQFVPIPQNNIVTVDNKERNLIFYSGISLLLFVPLFKTLTHLPPYMGMMFSVALLWFISETLHRKKAEQEQLQPSIFAALEKIDMPSVLFFFGILLAVSALQSATVLKQLAEALTQHVQSDIVIVSVIGLLSSVFDNVPLVAAIQGMFTLEQYPSGHFFWNYLAYCAGTGGSILIIGSAAGVAAMGIEQISFFWYLKNISFAALLGYLAGALVAVAIA